MHSAQSVYFTARSIKLITSEFVMEQLSVSYSNTAYARYKSVMFATHLINSTNTVQRVFCETFQRKHMDFAPNSHLSAYPAF